MPISNSGRTLLMKHKQFLAITLCLVIAGKTNSMESTSTPEIMHNDFASATIITLAVFWSIKKCLDREQKIIIAKPNKKYINKLIVRKKRGSQAQLKRMISSINLQTVMEEEVYQ